MKSGYYNVLIYFILAFSPISPLPVFASFSALTSASTHQWHLQNPSGPDINLAPALAEFGTSPNRIRVAIIDSGAAPIPSLIPNLWSPLPHKEGEPFTFGYNFLKPGHNPLDQNGHGTHIASIIGAYLLPGSPISGIAPFQVELMILQYLDRQLYGIVDHAALAIQYALDNKAQIINCSWVTDTNSPALEAALKRAKDMGVLIVAGVGNERLNIDHTPVYPASSPYSNILSVTAIQENGRLFFDPINWWGSNIGPRSVDIAAPGSHILGYNHLGLPELLSGTSMATSIVTGAIAYIWSHRPELSAAEIKELVLRTGRPLRDLRKTTLSGKTIDVYHALKNQVQPPDPLDPIHWPRQKMQLESPHPYPANFRMEHTFHIPGATRIAIHFKKIGTEGRDPILIYNDQRELVAQYSKQHQDIYSEIIEGSQVHLIFESDGSLEGFGFEIDHLAYQTD